MRPRKIRARCLAVYTRREIRDNSVAQRDEVLKIGTVLLNAGRLRRMGMWLVFGSGWNLWVWLAEGGCGCNEVYRFLLILSLLL